MTASVGLTAALRAAATPLFNQDFHAELRKTLKRHEKPCIRKLRVLQPNCCMQKALLPQSMHQVSGSQLRCAQLRPLGSTKLSGWVEEAMREAQESLLDSTWLWKSSEREVHLKGADVQRTCKYDVQHWGASKRRNWEVQTRDATEICNWDVQPRCEAAWRIWYWEMQLRGAVTGAHQRCK